MENLNIIFKDEIKAFMNLDESSQIEFKSARGGFPGSFWESYSAFANTDGGVIVLGVLEKNGQFHFDGLSKEQALKYKKNFWDCAHNKGKISVCLPKEGDVDIDSIGDAYFLICRIPRARYELRPVYIGSNPFGNTFRRDHEGDYLCTDAEVRRMFADAEHVRYSQDGRILRGFDIEEDIDKESLRQYRQVFLDLQPNHPWSLLGNKEFLTKIGAYGIDRESGREGLTLAGLLMFGRYESITNISALPAFFLDYREKLGPFAQKTRWTHRIYPDGLWEANLFQFYIKVYNRLIQSLPRPFMIKNGVRQEETPAHDAVREALVNTLIHNDTTALGNIVIEHTEEGFVFSNPGMMLVSKEQYFTGGRSVCRNPILQSLFMRLGRSEKAGSGVDKILAGWEYLGMPAPQVKEDTHPDYVVLKLSLKKSNEINTSQDESKITPQDGSASANTSQDESKITPQDGSASANTPQDESKITPQDGSASANTPQDESKITPQDESASANTPQDESKITPQDGSETANTPQDEVQDGKWSIRRKRRINRIVEFCNEPRSIVEIMTFLGLNDRKSFMEGYINPMMEEGVLVMTEPDKPTSKHQQYQSVGCNVKKENIGDSE